MFKRIKNLREEFNYSTSFVANYLNISTALYTLKEKGKREFKTKELIILARLYNTSIDYIVEETDERIKH